MKESNEINILDAICTDLQESICDLFDILKKQQTNLDQINSILKTSKQAPVSMGPNPTIKTD